VQTSRYDEAEKPLREAIRRDWYDAVAHVELGCVYLHRGNGYLPDAANEFRQALVIDPVSIRAAIGLAEALAKEGDDAEAESVLRKALDPAEPGGRWRIHQALAWLLSHQADRQQNAELLKDAYGEAQQAIRQAPAGAAEPYCVAGLVQFRMAALAREPIERRWCQRRARKHLSDCLGLEHQNVEARRYLDILEREMRWAAPDLGGFALSVVSFGLLALIWTMFFLDKKVSATMLSVNTPILVGLFTISTLLPTLIRLKMPGFEADLQPQPKQESLGPTGADTFGPGRFSVPPGPTGQIPRRSPARLQTVKSTKHA
jgi:Tfp pilus assembly protein PilF